MSEPFLIYDISIDERRPLTKADLAMLQAASNAYGRLRQAVETIQADLLREIVEIKERGGLPNEPGIPLRQPIDTTEIA